jgi:hypothetical protein
LGRRCRRLSRVSPVGDAASEDPASAALFCYIDRDLGLAQWADLGMYLQSIMLLLRAEGLHSCPQMAWSQVRNTVRRPVLRRAIGACPKRVYLAAPACSVAHDSQMRRIAGQR